MAHVLTIPKVNEPREKGANIAALAEELGLKTQARRYTAANVVERDFVPMSEDEVLVWRHFCGKAYATAAELTGYAFDTIPVEVLQYWKRLKENYAFDRFEIRTTEKVALPDPLLLGYFGKKVYLLARWGLESPEALPMREVATKVVQKLSSMLDYNWEGVFWTRKVYTGHLWSYEKDIIYQAALRLSR